MAFNTLARFFWKIQFMKLNEAIPVDQEIMKDKEDQQIIKSLKQIQKRMWEDSHVFQILKQ